MREGELVPDFELPDEAGTMRSLSKMLADGPVVLFFYPAAMTAGCTKEACYFRDIGAEFEARGAQRVGISPDPVARQKKFSERHSFDYPLLSDEDGEVARIFGVARSGLLGKLTPVKRSTFVIGTDQRLVKAISSEMNMNVHADEALRALS